MLDQLVQLSRQLLVMRIFGTTYARLVMPDPAASLARAGDSTALVSELGGNYEKYHLYLANALNRLGRPHPDDFPDSSAYMAAWAHVQEVVRAEDALRRAVVALEGGLHVSQVIPPAIALVDEDDRLVHMGDRTNVVSIAFPTAPPG